MSSLFLLNPVTQGSGDFRGTFNNIVLDAVDFIITQTICPAGNFYGGNDFSIVIKDGSGNAAHAQLVLLVVNSKTVCAYMIKHDHELRPVGDGILRASRQTACCQELFQHLLRISQQQYFSRCCGMHGNCPPYSFRCSPDMAIWTVGKIQTNSRHIFFGINKSGFFALLRQSIEIRLANIPDVELGAQSVTDFAKTQRQLIFERFAVLCCIPRRDQRRDKPGNSALRHGDGVSDFLQTQRPPCQCHHFHDF